MTSLTVHDLARTGGTPRVIDGYDAVRAELAAAGVVIERRPLPPGDCPRSGRDGWPAAYQSFVEGVKAECGFAAADLLSVGPDTDDAESLRARFLVEHTHAEDEARVFLDGTGAFYLHIADRVLVVVCGRGDFLNVPAGTPHWFDMGPAPRFTAIRFFTRPDGWVAIPTGDPIAERLPRYDGPGQGSAGPSPDHPATDESRS